ncbi:MAG: DUF1330 domain-containing protein [Bacteroidales bacterium]|nr:DUF1330 domain-containing protein [Bacteroidales bacterium]
MPYYFIAQIKIHDEEDYQKYIERAGSVFSKYNGEYLAVDDKPSVLEGIWDYTRTVIIRFNSKIDFELWYNSEEYREIRKYRLNAARCDTILVKGLETTPP